MTQDTATRITGPRERALEEGLDALGDADLVAILLGTGTQGRPVALVAAALCERAGGLDRLARTDPQMLAEHPGVGLAKAVRVAAAFELGKRACVRERRPATPLRCAAEVAAYFTARLANLVHEEMWMLALDGRNGVRAARRVAQGGLHGCSITARDVLRVALVSGASSFALVHNHPSGDPTPSREDVALTRVVAEAAMIVGTPLVDHVIVASDGRHASLLELGLLRPSGD